MVKLRDIGLVSEPPARLVSSRSASVWFSAGCRHGDSEPGQRSRGGARTDEQVNASGWMRPIDLTTMSSAISCPSGRWTAGLIATKRPRIVRSGSLAPDRRDVAVSSSDRI
jgi:hypothetical protein